MYLCGVELKSINMSPVELEIQRANLAQEILRIDDAAIINSVWIMLKDYKSAKPKKREIGFLEGKAKVIFHDGWNMTPEELEMA